MIVSLLFTLLILSSIRIIRLSIQCSLSSTLYKNDWNYMLQIEKKNLYVDDNSIGWISNIITCERSSWKSILSFCCCWSWWSLCTSHSQTVMFIHTQRTIQKNLKKYLSKKSSNVKTWIHTYYHQTTNMKIIMHSLSLPKTCFNRKECFQQPLWIMDHWRFSLNDWNTKIVSDE